uniref:Neuronal membrane glycoprotein M6-a n=1 Tax=Melopsittacus undulatus TaxID=13146 RepID=A0A8V5GIA2_MELUD
VGCFECCIKCLGGIPYASLIATILLYAGVALFCGCGHEALSGTVNILQTYFEMTRKQTVIDIFKYVIYGVAAAFFVYGILLMVEGFFTTGAIKDLYGDFKITTCGRCVSAWVSGYETFCTYDNFNIFCMPCDVYFLVVYFFDSLIFSCLGKKSAKGNRVIGCVCHPYIDVTCSTVKLLFHFFFFNFSPAQCHGMILTLNKYCCKTFK